MFLAGGFPTQSGARSWQLVQPAQIPKAPGSPDSLHPRSSQTPASNSHGQILFRTFRQTCRFPGDLAQTSRCLPMISHWENRRSLRSRNCFVQKGTFCMSSVKVSWVPVAPKKVTLAIISPALGGSPSHLLTQEQSCRDTELSLLHVFLRSVWPMHKNKLTECWQS